MEMSSSSAESALISGVTPDLIIEYTFNGSSSHRDRP